MEKKSIVLVGSALIVVACFLLVATIPVAAASPPAPTFTYMYTTAVDYLYGPWEVSTMCNNYGEEPALVNFTHTYYEYHGDPLFTHLTSYNQRVIQSRDSYSLTNTYSLNRLVFVTIKTNSSAVVCDSYLDSYNDGTYDYTYFPGDFATFEWSRGKWERVL